jgi:hypothetical protein
MTSVQNLGMALLPLLLGIAQDSPAIRGTPLQYTVPIIVFIGCAGVSFLLAGLNLILDTRANRGRSIMNAPDAQRKSIRRQLAEFDREQGTGIAPDSPDPILTPKLLRQLKTDNKRTRTASARVVDSRQASEDALGSLGNSLGSSFNGSGGPGSLG